MLNPLQRPAARCPRHPLPAGGDRPDPAAAVGNLPWWCSGWPPSCWCGAARWRCRPPAARPGWRVALLALTLVATYATHRTLLGRDAGVTLVVVLLALKTLELRARRDAFVVFFLGFFTMLTNFFYSQSLLDGRSRCCSRCWAC